MNKYIYKYLKYKNKYKKMQMVGGTVPNAKASHSYYGLKIDNFDFDTLLKNSNRSEDEYNDFLPNYRNFLKSIGCTNPEVHTKYENFYNFILESKLNNKVYFDDNKVLDYMFNSDGIILFFFLIDIEDNIPKIYLINENNTFSCISIFKDTKTSNLGEPKIIEEGRASTDGVLVELPRNTLAKALNRPLLGQSSKSPIFPHKPPERGRSLQHQESDSASNMSDSAMSDN